MSLYVVFEVGADPYGVEIEYVRSIERVLPMTRLPNVHPAIRGVVNLRGTVVPIMDLNLLFGNAETMLSDHARMVILEVENIPFGLLVDGTKGVVELASDSIQPVSGVIQGSRVQFLRGVTLTDNFILALIDVLALLRVGQQGRD